MSLKIMVVDDEAQSGKVIRSLAVPLGHKVLNCADSGEASQQAQKQRIDLAFVGMPRPDGLEVAKGIHDSRSGGETTVVMLSAADDVDICRKAFGAGASFVMPKPIAASRVLGMLSAMESPDWKCRRHAARLPLFTDVTCKMDDREISMRSMNISETGMLVQSPEEVEPGHEVSLEFKLAGVVEPLRVRGRIVRKQGTSSVGVEFMGLAPEEQNAIQLYVMGRAGEKAPSKESGDLRVRRFWTTQT